MPTPEAAWQQFDRTKNSTKNSFVPTESQGRTERLQGVTDEAVHTGGLSESSNDAGESSGCLQQAGSDGPHDGPPDSTAPAGPGMMPESEPQPLSKVVFCWAPRLDCAAVFCC